MQINRRTALAALSSLALASAAVLAHAADDSATVNASKIVKSLSKDVVLDRPGANATARNLQAARQPAIDLFVQFGYNSAELQAQGRQQLDELGKALNHKALSKWGFELAGHTDAAGSAEYNLKLSLERANAVKNYLVVQHGLNPQRLLPIGFGLTRLANPTEPTAAINRRVEVRRVAMAGEARRAAPAPGAAPVAATPSQPVLGGRLVTSP